jgi:hypothetical protein
VIDSTAALHSSKSRKTLAVKHTNLLQSNSPDSNSFQTPKFSKSSRKLSNLEESDGEVLQEHHNRPSKVARSCAPRSGEENRMVVFKQLQRTPTTPSYSSQDSGRFSAQEISPVSDCSPFDFRCSDDKENLRLHSLPGRLPSVPLFKEYQNCAMAVTMLASNIALRPGLC